MNLLIGHFIWDLVSLTGAQPSNPVDEIREKYARKQLRPGCANSNTIPYAYGRSCNVGDFFALDVSRGLNRPKPH